MNLSGLILSMGLIVLIPSNKRVSTNFMHNEAFVNTIVDGNKCNTFGYEKYVQNSDAASAYSVTLKVVAYKAGSGSKESQKIVSVPAGGKTYAGCSESAEVGGPSYTYTVVGESKQ